ncbi:hypothetical protein A33Q_1290 [Indibacter alkaliphilus LW1]|jgi:hypothetical protein|uniref:Uncharacterized protein n=1 Tax=Indibacter alkaliphilus (strain CCUG 57479 / KCTC 22604 / LW1) TaxID=1189612 RepID=S2E2E5_INDAL|nr:hypothetical protein [Indibacter alkaliphilus]EOZ98636.1 hypothetical protein A33Q_1290 [Indibacter alkaliphilus LW1]
MKSRFFILSIMVMFIACQMDREFDSDLEEEDDENVSITDVDEVTDSLHETFFEFEVEGGDQNSAFQDQNEGLHGIYGVSRTDANNLEGNQLNIFNCFQSINLSLPQLNQIRAATNSFSACRNSEARIYKQEFNALLNQFETERKRLVDGHQGSPASLQAELQDLRQQFREALLNLKKDYSDDLKSCLRDYVSNIKRRLNDSQWESFKNCVVD